VLHVQKKDDDECGRERREVVQEGRVCCETQKVGRHEEGENNTPRGTRESKTCAHNIKEHQDDAVRRQVDYTGLEFSLNMHGVRPGVNDFKNRQESEHDSYIN
jgi:hypothetical protein